MNSTEALKRFNEVTKQELDKRLSIIDENLFIASKLILDAQKNNKRVHLTGIGKPGHLAGYISSLLSSIGIPSYFLDGTECVHGSSGQVLEDDVVIVISNSGQTMEMQACVKTLKNNGAKIIGVSGNSESFLAINSDVHLLAHIDNEGGPLNRVPRNSILAETIILQQLSVILQAEIDLTPEQYVKHHPGGALGKLRENERKI